MKYFNLTVLLCLLLCGGQIDAQRSCSTDDYLQIQLVEDPAAAERMAEIERFTESYINSGPQLRSSASVTIPVVVHIVYKRGNQNLSDAQILSQIQVLNEDFTRTNPDADATWSQAGNPDIDFCLATVDPSGNPTNGITRRSTNKNQFSYISDDVKFNSSGGTDAWPASQYLNIWVCNLGSGLLGYAQFPGSGSASTDGVVIDYAYFGRGGSASAPFNLGRTCTHEVGHWLNLRHIWGDGGCGATDFVSDTPDSDGPNYGCALGNVACGTVDMVQNYMDYSDDACMNLFTSGQGVRMNSVLSPGGFRASLTGSPGCGGGGTGGTCDVPSGLNATSVTETDAVLNWTAVSGALSYNVRARAVGATTWATGSGTGTSINFTGLSSCTDYEFQVEAVCSGSLSGYSASATFTTAGCTGGSCADPTGTVVNSVSKKKANVGWNAVSGATSYTVEYRPVGGSWSSKNTTSTTTNLTGLSNGTTYEWQVQANCGSTSSAFVAGPGFTAGSSLRFEETFSFYPNPASSTLHIRSEAEGTVRVELHDLAGRRIVATNYSFEYTGVLDLDVSTLANGMYMLRLTTEDGESTVHRVAIRH